MSTWNQDKVDAKKLRFYAEIEEYLENQGKSMVLFMDKFGTISRSVAALVCKFKSHNTLSDTLLAVGEMLEYNRRELPGQIDSLPFPVHLALQSLKITTSVADAVTSLKDCPKFWCKYLGLLLSIDLLNTKAETCSLGQVAGVDECTILIILFAISVFTARVDMNCNCNREQPIQVQNTLELGEFTRSFTSKFNINSHMPTNIQWPGRAFSHA
uniref:Uncharacterized protein n=1 Tax=Ditylenchus dipsaci TaxID=166011 RepID=A0A915DQ14_9BILA